MWSRSIAALLVSLAGCETAEDKCRDAQDGAYEAWDAYLTVAIDENRTAQSSREAAAQDVVFKACRALEDTAQGVALRLGMDHPAGNRYQQLEGSVAAAVLAVDALEAADETEKADALRQELDRIMTGDLETLIGAGQTGEGDALVSQAEALGEALSNLISELSAEVRAQVLRRYAGLEDQLAGEAEPYAETKAAWGSYQEAADEARVAAARSRLSLVARDAARESSGTLETSAAEVPTHPAQPLFGAATTASMSCVAACKEAGM
ncbi:MAG: hypothetical protein AAGF12_25645 [Myxococcota bacterium]